MTSEHVLNTPLNGGEQTAVTVFLVLVLLSVPALGAGLFMGALLGLGLYLTRRTNDFSYLANVMRVLKGLLGIAAAGSALAGAYWAKESFDHHGHIGGDAKDTFAFCVVATIYLLSFKLLFVDNLERHSEWVAANGIFATKPKDVKPHTAPEAAPATYAPGTPHSAADELLKWAALKDAGHVTEEQYEAQRLKILSRS